MNTQLQTTSFKVSLILALGLTFVSCQKKTDNNAASGKNLVFSEKAAEGKIADLAWKYRSGSARMETDFDGTKIISFKLYSFELTDPCFAMVDGDFILGSAPNKIGEFYYEPVISSKVDKGTTLTFLSSVDNSSINLVATQAKVRIDRIECGVAGDDSTCTKVIGAVTGYHDSAKYGGSEISGTFEIPICQ